MWGLPRVTRSSGLFQSSIPQRFDRIPPSSTFLDDCTGKDENKLIFSDDDDRLFLVEV